MLDTHVRRATLLLPLLLTASSLIAAPPGVDAKIDAELIARFVNSEDGMAPFFVMLGERTPLGSAHNIKDWAARGRFVVQQLQATANRSQAGIRGYLQGRRIAYTPYWVENKIYIPQGTLDLARDLARRPEVAAILAEVIYSIPAPQTTGTSVQSIGWNISLIGADRVWSAYGNTGTGAVVANIDTGVQYSHPALVAQYRGNLGGGLFNHAGNWYDPTGVCGAAPCDNSGHGTHTMGTMAGGGAGVANQIGVAPGARWIACKGCEGSSCSGSYLTACAQWILAPGGDPALRPNAVNNSWGGSGGSTWYQSYVQNWVAAGIFPAFSNGNSGPACGTAGSPGDNPVSFASGATNSSDNIASFSSRGPSKLGGVKPNISAPGSGIYSSVPTNSYASYSGTSMASPHTAGTVALLWAIRPSYLGNVSATAALLQSTAAVRTTSESCGGIPAGASPNNTYGAGRIDAFRAVETGSGAVNQAPTLAITAPAANGQQFNCGTAVNFAATASDREDGDLSQRIQSSGAGTPGTAFGANVTKTFSCTAELGSQVVTASVSDSGGLAASDSVVVTIVNPNGPPPAPSGLNASASAGAVRLSWTDNSLNEQGFKVYRRAKSGKNWSPWLPLTATPTTPSYTDTGLSGGSYQYYVTAFNTSGESAPSGSVNARVK